MKLSEIGLMRLVLCKHAKAEHSAIFEIMKLSYSGNLKAAYVRTTVASDGIGTRSFHSWWDVEELDSKYEIFDFVETRI
jgi:hypothetical protein